MSLRFHLDTYTLALEIGALWLIPSMCYKLHVYTSFTSGWIDRLTALLASASPRDVAPIWKVGTLFNNKLRGEFFTAPLGRHGHTCLLRETTCALAACGVLCSVFKQYTVNPLDFPIPAAGIEPIPRARDLDMRVCAACRDLMQKKHREMCEAFWDTLPEELGLGTWAELRALKARDLGQSVED
ncbi:hypothetical protein BD626DRAFT_499969 [Schizophyllum amplum]|uniref:Uncharacterized protein n=1 Tax=Schizophyllum amplum TaxID=97359 RepID=A0A550CBD2_9AGAR|nr:hypothetical protein BD626DRAFT_499969 [Auriculariopsis ampla]